MNQPEKFIECPHCDWSGSDQRCYADVFGGDRCPQCMNEIAEPPRSPAKVMQGPLDVEEPVNPWTLELARMSQRTQEAIIQNYEQAPENRLRLEIQAELTRAKAKFPDWPTDPMHAVGILGEEYGEVLKDCLQLTYEPTKTNLENLRKEAVQMAAMAHRFLESLDRYVFEPSAQHRQ